MKELILTVFQGWKTRKIMREHKRVQALIYEIRDLDIFVNELRREKEDSWAKMMLPTTKKDALKKRQELVA